MKRVWWLGLITLSSFFVSLFSMNSFLGSCVYACVVCGLAIFGLGITKRSTDDISVLVSGFIIFVFLAAVSAWESVDGDTILMIAALAIQILVCWGIATILSRSPLFTKDKERGKVAQRASGPSG